MSSRSPNKAAALYGTVLATALIAAYSEDPGSDPGQVAVGVVVAAIVFWLAHAYAGLLAVGAEGAEPSVRTAISGVLAEEWPLVVGALPPVAPLLLAPLGILSTDNAETLAIVTGIVMLAAGGLAAARVRRLGAFGTLATVGASAAFGIVIVALKAIVH